MDGLAAKGEKALVVFFTAGDQALEDIPSILEALVQGGADVIEVGIPFSDPFGEGPTIQASSQRALERGVNPIGILDQIAKFQSPVPIVTMGYYNNYWRLGLDAIASRMAAAGVSGAIISDLVPDEGEEWCRAAAQHGLDTIFLVAPTSTEARIQEACSRSTGFVYAVSRTGVTGAENAVPIDVGELIAEIKSHTSLPVFVGFGISTPEHVSRVCQVADGAVVGSTVVETLREYWPHDRSSVVEAVRSLKEATR